MQCGKSACWKCCQNYSFRLSSVRRTPEKNAIGAAAARHVNSGDRIYLDSGTTVLKMANALASRIRHGEISGISIVTNSLSCMDNLSELTGVILVGGIIRPARRDVCGPLAEKYLSEYHIDLLVTGCDGADAQQGFYTSDLNLANLEKLSVKVSDKVIVITESRKFGKKALVKFAEITDIDAIITDNRLKAIDRELITRNGVEVFTA